MREPPKQHMWYYTRQSPLRGGEQGPFTEQQMLELATLGKIKLDTLLRSPTKTDNQEILAESIPKLAFAINQAEIGVEAKRQAVYDQSKKEQKALADKKRAVKEAKQELVIRKENEIEGYLEIPIQRTQIPTQSNKSSIDYSKLEEYSREYRPISVGQKPCSFCDELVSGNAKKCKHCNEIIDVVLRASLAAQNIKSPTQITLNVAGGTANATSNSNAKAEIVQGCSGCGCLLIVLFVIMAIVLSS